MTTLSMELAKLRQAEILHDAQDVHIELGTFHDEEQELIALELERRMAVKAEQREARERELVPA